MSEPKRTMPSRTLLQGMAYTNAASTCLRTRFAAIRAEQQKLPASVAQIRKKK
jgi:hypothetical protein